MEELDGIYNLLKIKEILLTIMHICIANGKKYKAYF